MMATLLSPIYQALLGVGVLSLAACALLALTWGWIEPRLLHWLEHRRTRREAGPRPRTAIRRPR